MGDDKARIDDWRDLLERWTRPGYSSFSLSLSDIGAFFEAPLAGGGALIRAARTATSLALEGEDGALILESFDEAGALVEVAAATGEAGVLITSLLFGRVGVLGAERFGILVTARGSSGD